MVFFLECLEMSLFCWRQFGRCTISRPSLAFPLTFNVFENSAHILFSLQLRRCDVLFGKLRRNSFCFMSFMHHRALPRTNLHISIFCAYMCIMSKSGKVRSGTKSFGNNSPEKLERLCFLFKNDKIQNTEKLSVFPGCPTDFHAFQEWIR